MKKLFNPFETGSEKNLILSGLAALTAGSWIGSLLKGRFDGIIDLHFAESATFFRVLSDNLINTALLTLCLYLLGRYINSKTRIIDVLSTALIARIPFYILPFFNLNNQIDQAGKHILVIASDQEAKDFLFSDIIIILVFAVFALLALVWFAFLSWNGFKTATNAKEKRHLFYFIIVLFLAEFLSKIIFSLI